MKPSIKLATIYAVAATLALPNAFAAKSDDWFATKNTSVGGAWNASGSLVYSTTSYNNSVDDIKDFNDFGQKVKIKDLKVDLDLLAKAFDKDIRARLGLEENSDELEIDLTELKSKVRELSVGVSPVDGAVVAFGRMDIPFGGDVSRRAIDRNSAIHRALEQNERTVQAVLALDPSSIKALSAIKSVEISKFASSSKPNDLKFNNTLNSEAVRVIALLGPVLTQASYMKVQGEERQMSVSGEMGLSTTITGPLTVYGEAQAIRDSVISGDLDLYSLGLEKALPDILGRASSAYVEGTNVKNKATKKTANEVAAGLKLQATDRIEVAAEYSNYAPGTKGIINAQKDHTVSVTASVKRKNKATKTTLFPYSSAKKSAQDAAVDAMRSK